MIDATRVIIFEDEPEILGMMTDFLEISGCLVVGSAQTMDDSRTLISEIEPEAFEVALVDGNLSRGALDRKEGEQIVTLLREKFSDTVRIFGTSGAGDIPGVDDNVGKMLSKRVMSKILGNELQD